MRSAVRLYGTEFCHLCEEAEAVLRQVQIEAEYIDIAGEDSLLEKYGSRIPVLLRMDTGEELGWPFDAVAVTRLLGLNKSPSGFS